MGIIMNLVWYFAFGMLHIVLSSRFLQKFDFIKKNYMFLDGCRLHNLR